MDRSSKGPNGAPTGRMILLVVAVVLLVGLSAAQPAPPEVYRLDPAAAETGEGATTIVFLQPREPDWTIAPWRFRRVFSETMIVPEGRTLTLASNPDGTEAPFDAFFLFEVRQGATVDRFLIGFYGWDDVVEFRYGGAEGAALRFEAGDDAFITGPADLGAALPAGTPFTLTVSALDEAFVVDPTFLVAGPARAEEPRDDGPAIFALSAPTVRIAAFSAERDGIEADIVRVEREIRDDEAEYQEASAALERAAGAVADLRERLDRAVAEVAEHGRALDRHVTEIGSLTLDEEAMPVALAHLVLAKFELEQRLRDAEDRLAERDPAMTAEERDRLLATIESIRGQLVPIDGAIAERMAAIDAEPREAGAPPITYAQLEADRDALRRDAPELRQQLERALDAREDLVRQLGSARLDHHLALGLEEVRRERLESRLDRLFELRQRLVELGAVGTLGTVEARTSDRLVFQGELNEEAYRQLLTMRDRLAELRVSLAEIALLRGEFRQRFVELTNELITMEQELIDETLKSYLSQGLAEVTASAISLTVSAVTAGPVGVLVDAATQIGANFLFNEGGVAFETLDERAFRTEFEAVRQRPVERPLPNDCSGTYLQPFLEPASDAIPRPSWSSGVLETVQTLDEINDRMEREGEQLWPRLVREGQAGATHLVKTATVAGGQIVYLNQRVSSQYAALREINRALASGATEETVGSFWGGYLVDYGTALREERAVLNGFRQRLNDFTTLRGWGGAVRNGVGTFLLGIVVREVKDGVRAEILDAERDAWAAFFQRELEASVTWVALMRASCVYWAVVDEESFMASAYDEFLSLYDDDRTFLATVKETFTSDDELIVAAPFDGEGDFRVEVTIAGVVGEPRSDGTFVFPAGSFEASTSGSDLEVVIEVLPN